MDYLAVARDRLAALREDITDCEKSELSEKRWDTALADAWIAVSVARISAWHDELGYAGAVDGPDWQAREAAVNSAYALKERSALHQALEVYERFAFTVFLAAAGRSPEVSP